MAEQSLVRISKFLSKHLRHQPEALGLTLEPGGWVLVADLLAACARQRLPISQAELEEVVRGSDKQRFAFDATGLRIRANQGHSVTVDLQLVPQAPPAQLYHGTSAGHLDSILRQGVLRMARHHVHLSADRHTANKVGSRHGAPVVLTIDAAAMAGDGHQFYRSDNGVWLVDEVPPRYITLPEAGGRHGRSGG